MYIELFQNLGLSKNESEIYESLLKEGELNATEISLNSGVHRRNTYDVLRRLQQKGLVFEIQNKRESRYQVVDPKKLTELIKEKEELLDKYMPGLSELYHERPSEKALYIYRGIEGWKNVMRDILLQREDYYCIAGKGAWMDPRMEGFFPWFCKEMQKKKIKCHVLFEHEIKKTKHPITTYVGDDYRFLPQEFASPASIEIFGDYVVLVSDIEFGGMKDEITLAVHKNRTLANAFRIWFRFMWNGCKK